MNDIKTIKHDSGDNDFQTLRYFLQDHGKTVLTVLCIVIASFLTITIYRNNARKKEHQSSMMLSSARSAQDLETLIEKYSSSTITPLATVRLAKVYFDAGNYNMALGKYDDFLQKYPEHLFASIAEMGKIHCIEATSQTETALQLFSDFIKKDPDHFLVPEAIFGQARCFSQMDRDEEAKALYEDFIVANQKSGWLLKTKELLERVNKKIAEAQDSENTQP